MSELHTIDKAFLAALGQDPDAPYACRPSQESLAHDDVAVESDTPPLGTAVKADEQSVLEPAARSGQDEPADTERIDALSPPQAPADKIRLLRRYMVARRAAARNYQSCDAGPIPVALRRRVMRARAEALQAVLTRTIFYAAAEKLPDGCFVSASQAGLVFRRGEWLEAPPDSVGIVVFADPLLAVRCVSVYSMSRAPRTTVARTDAPQPGIPRRECFSGARVVLEVYGDGAMGAVGTTTALHFQRLLPLGILRHAGSPSPWMTPAMRYSSAKDYNCTRLAQLDLLSQVRGTRCFTPDAVGKVKQLREQSAWSNSLRCGRKRSHIVAQTQWSMLIFKALFQDALRADEWHTLHTDD